MTSRLAFSFHTLHSCPARDTSSRPENHALPAMRAPRASVFATETERGAARGGRSGVGLRCTWLARDAPPPPRGPPHRIAERRKGNGGWVRAPPVAARRRCDAGGASRLGVACAAAAAAPRGV